MSTELPPLSEAQLEIMNVIWERGQASVSEVRDALLTTREVARNTVQTQLTRLESKGWLRHEDHSGVFVYAATRPRRGVLAGLVSRLVDRTFGGSADQLVQSLLHGRSLSSDEAQRIRELLDAATTSGAEGAESRQGGAR